MSSASRILNSPGAGPAVIRLSIGIELAYDISGDLDQAMRHTAEATKAKSKGKTLGGEPAKVPSAPAAYKLQREFLNPQLGS